MECDRFVSPLVALLLRQKERQQAAALHNVKHLLQ